MPTNAIWSRRAEVRARRFARKTAARAYVPAGLALISVFVCLGFTRRAAQKMNPAAKNTSEPASELRIEAANVQMLLIAPDAKETGYDPKSRKVLRVIPDSAYYEDALLAYDSGRVDPNTTQTIDVRRPAPGNYRLLISPGTATDGEEYEILV